MWNIHNINKQFWKKLTMFKNNIYEMIMYTAIDRVQTSYIQSYDEKQSFRKNAYWIMF